MGLFFMEKIKGAIYMEKMTDKMTFYKISETDKIWWVGDLCHDVILYGKDWITFDRKKIYNLWTDYPHNMTPDEVELFNREHPQRAEFFAWRKDCPEEEKYIMTQEEIDNFLYKDNEVFDETQSFEDYKKAIVKYLVLCPWHYRKDQAEKLVERETAYIKKEFDARAPMINTALDIGYMCG